METEWKLSTEVRRATWNGLKVGRDFDHGPNSRCEISFERAERLLASTSRSGHVACIDRWIDVLAWLAAPKRLAQLDAAANPGGYARQTARSSCTDVTRNAAMRRGSIGKPRQLRGVRLKISQELADPWLDELASLLIECASSARNPEQGWPHADFALAKAKFLGRPELGDDLVGVTADVSFVEATMAAVDERWYWRVIRGAQLSYRFENPLSTDVVAVDGGLIDEDRDVSRAALRAQFLRRFGDPALPTLVDAVAAASAGVGGVVPRDRAMMTRAGVFMLAAELADVALAGLDDLAARQLIAQRFGAAGAAKATAAVLRGVRATQRDDHAPTPRKAEVRA